MIIETHLDNASFYFDLWKEHRDKIKEDHEVQFNSIGFDIGYKDLPAWFHDNIREDFSKATKQKLDKIIHCWGIDYLDGGYQTAHRHGPNTWNSILFFDGQPRSDKMDTLNGLTWFIDGETSRNIAPEFGKLIMFTNDVWHGVYPCKAPRRSFMVDFKR